MRPIGCKQNGRWIMKTLAMVAAIGLAVGMAFSTQPPPISSRSAELACAKALEDNEVIRRHGWEILEEVTAPATGGRAFWETWDSRKRIWANNTNDNSNETPNSLESIRQFRMSEGLVGSDGANEAALDASGVELRSSEVLEGILSEVRFNPAASDHIKRNNYHLPGAFRELRRRRAQKIVDFPSTAIVIKAVWWPVSGDEPTAVPVWDGVPGRPIEDGVGAAADNKKFGNDFSRWGRALAIDPKNHIPPGAQATVRVPRWRFLGSPRGEPQPLPVVPLKRFHSRTLTEADLTKPERLDNAFQLALGRNARLDDKLVLVGLHVITKELPDWVWMTIWWHDVPEEGTFAAQRPIHMRSPWRNYLMDITVSAETPRADDGGPKIIFNPWLEAPFARGLESNCMACHQKAVVLSTDKDAQVVDRGERPHSDTCFDDKTRLDYLWSIKGD